MCESRHPNANELAPNCSKNTEVAKAVVTVFSRVSGFRVSLVLVIIFAWSSLAFCGEIHEAVKNNDIAKVKELIKSSPDLVFSKDENGFTPLHLAAANGYRDMVEFLLTTKAEVNATDNAGSTPLHQAAVAEGNNADLIETLLAHGANVNTVDKLGLTPLHYATLANNVDAVKSLLSHGANPNAKDYEAGDTPLVLAAGRGYKEIAELLLAHGADVNTADNIGTPLVWARRGGHGDIADLLRRHGGHE